MPAQKLTRTVLGSTSKYSNNWHIALLPEDSIRSAERHSRVHLRPKVMTATASADAADRRYLCHLKTHLLSRLTTMLHKPSGIVD